jgi:non-specific serine/threonine protein kinase
VRAALFALLLASCAPVTTIPSGPSPATTSGPPATALTPAASSAAAGWRRIADIPTPRSEVAAAVDGSAVHVIGGFGGDRVVETYLTAGDRWLLSGVLPIGVDHAMAAPLPGVRGEASHVVVLGGNAGGTPTARVFRGTLGAAGGIAWDEIASMPAPRSQGAAVTLGTTIYVVGGYDGRGLAAPTFAYDGEQDRWRTVAAIPTPRDHLAAAALGGRVCAVGGRRLSLLQNLAAFECYDPRADAWTKLKDAPTARGGVGAAVVGSKLVFVGGEQPLGTFREVEIYDDATGMWSKGPDLPTPRHGLGVVALGSVVYVMAGGPTPGGSQTAVCEALDLR